MARWFWALLVLGTYAASFAMPVCLDLAGHEAFTTAARLGMAASVQGEVSKELLGWLPNVLLWLGLAFLVAGDGKGAAEFGLAALIGAAGWLSLCGLMPGYYVWAGSMALLVAGGVWVATAATDDAADHEGEFNSE